MEPEHISHLLSSNIGKIGAEIEKEGEKLLREKTPASMPEFYLKKFQEYVAKLSILALNPRPEEKDVDDIIMDFRNLEMDSKIKMPSAIYSLIGSLYKSAAKRPEKMTTKEASIIKKTIDAYSLALENESDPIERARILVKIADNYYELALANHKEIKSNLIKAVKAYLKALDVRTLSSSPRTMP